MFFAGIVGLYLHSTFEIRFLISFGTVTIVGIGSFAFHETLLFPLQMLDEVPMIYCVLALTYCCVEDKPTLRHGAWFPIGIAVYGFIITLVLFVTGPKSHMFEFLFFQSAFAITVIVVVSHAIRIYRATTDEKICRVWIVTTVFLAISYILWNVDFRMCDRMQNLPQGLWNPQLHAVWHVGSSIGLYLFTLLSCFHRSKNLGREPILEWKGRIIPYVVETKKICNDI